MKGMKLTLTAKLVLAFAVMVVIIGALAVIAFTSFRSIDVDAELMEDKTGKIVAVLTMKFASRATMDAFADMYISQDVGVYDEMAVYLELFENELGIFQEDADAAEITLAAALDELHEGIDNASSAGLAAAKQATGKAFSPYLKMSLNQQWPHLTRRSMRR